MLHKFQMKTNRVFKDEAEIVECLHEDFRFCTLYREDDFGSLEYDKILYDGFLSTCDEDTRVHRVYHLLVAAFYIGSPFHDYEYRYILKWV